MVSYTSSSYTTDFFDLSGVYFNSTTQSSGSSSVDLDELDKRYLLKAGGNISNNLVVDGSLDVKTALTLPIIGDVEDAIQGKQNTINDGDLIYAAHAMPRTLAVTRWRVQCHSGRQKQGEIVHLAVFVVTAPMAPGPMCTKRPWLRPMPCAPAKQQAYT